MAANAACVNALEGAKELEGPVAEERKAELRSEREERERLVVEIVAATAKQGGEAARMAARGQYIANNLIKEKSKQRRSTLFTD